MSADKKLKLAVAITGDASRLKKAVETTTADLDKTRKRALDLENALRDAVRRREAQAGNRAAG